MRSFSVAVSGRSLIFPLAVSLDLCRRKYGIRIVVLPSSSIAQQGLGFIDIGAPLPTSLDITSSDLLPGIWGIGVPHLQLMATAHCEDWRFINSASLVFAILRLVTIDTSFDNHVSFVSALRVFLGCYGKLGMSGAAFATFSIGLSSDLEILYNLGRPSGVPEMVILQIALERLAAKTGAYKRMAVTPTQKAAKVRRLPRSLAGSELIFWIADDVDVRREELVDPGALNLRSLGCLVPPPPLLLLSSLESLMARRGLRERGVVSNLEARNAALSPLSATTTND